MPYITETQLREKLRPLINARLSSSKRGERLYLDLRAAWHEDSDDARIGYPDCDVRSLTGKGVLRQWDGGEEIIPWRLIRTVTFGQYLRGDDGWLHYRPGATYQVIRQRQPAQGKLSAGVVL